MFGESRPVYQPSGADPTMSVRISYRPAKMGRLFFGADVLIAQPAEPMSGNLMAGRGDGCCGSGVPGQRGRHGEHRKGNTGALENA